jgi:PAS domain S-box-containing protein
VLEEIQAFLEQAPFGFHSLDGSGAFVDVNATELAWLGYTRDELIGKNIRDILAPESVAVFAKHFPLFKRRGSLRDLEIHLIRKNGSTLPTLVCATAVRDLQGRFVRSLSALSDLTERKQANQKFRELMEAAPDAMVVTGPDGEMTLMNAKAEKLFGYTREELVGRDIEMLVPVRFRDRHVAHRKEYSANPTVRPVRTMDLRGLRKDGTEFPADISLSPLENSEEVLVLSTIRDITERNRIHEALRESEERYRLALKTSSVVLFNQDRELRYTWISSPVLAWASQSYLGRTDAEIIGGEEGARLMAIKEGVMRDGIGTRSEIVLTFEDSRHYYDLTVEPLRDRAGAVVGITCAAVDVTSVKQAAAEIERLNLHRLKFLGMATHDLRSPIVAILSLVEYQCDNMDIMNSEEHLRFLSDIRSSSEFMLELIDDFLDMSAIESGRMRLRRHLSDLHKLLERVVNPKAELARLKQIHVSLHIEGALPELSIDEEKIEQVVRNLLSNAIKFSEPGTAVVVYAGVHDGSVLISVRDHGPGISEAERAQLFQPFGRTSARSTAGERSTGLGLAIAQTIVEEHGGHIQVESRPGVGSLFFFTLPVGKWHSASNS